MILEILQNLAGVAFLGIPFFLLTVFANRKSGKSLFSPSGVLISYPPYLLFQVLLMKALHYLHGINFLAVSSAYLLADAGLLLAIFRTKTKPPPKAEAPHENEKPIRGVRRLVLWTAAAAVLFIAVIALLRPFHLLDENVYHLPMVAQYFQNRSLAPWATQCLRQIARPNAAELQMLNLALLTHSDAWMEIVQILALVISLVAVFELAKLVLGQSLLAFLAVSSVLTTPQILLGAGTANNDLIFMALILCAFYWTIRGAVDPSVKPAYGMALVGLCAALACATKVVGFCVFATLLVTLLLIAWRRKIPWTGVGWFLLSGVFFLLLLSGEIYWRNFIRFGIPIGVVPGEDRPTNFEPIFGPSVLPSFFHFYFYKLGLERPFLKGIVDQENSHLGYLFPLLLPLGALAAFIQFFNIKSARKTGLWILALLTLFLFLSITAFRKPTSYDQRWMIWAVPCFGILSLSFLERWSSKKVSIATFALSLFCLVYLPYIYVGSNFFGEYIRETMGYVFKQGELPRATLVGKHPWLKKRLKGYEILEAQAQSSDRVLYIGGKETAMYPCWGRKFTRTVAGVEDLEDAYRKIHSKEYRFIVWQKEAEKVLRDDTLRQAKSLGYVRIANAKHRVIYKRPD